MRGFMAFTKKEFTEYIRSYKLLIILMVFLMLGFVNPVSAKYLPKLVENFMPAGMKMEIPEPVIADAWVQFFKNVPQIGLVVMVIITSGTVSQEQSRGTLLPVLTKGLKRKTVWLSKFTGAAVLWSAGYYLAFAVTGGLLLAGMLMSMLHSISRYSPVRLASENMSLIDGTLKVEDFLPAAAVAAALTVAAVLAGIVLFDKKQL